MRLSGVVLVCGGRFYSDWVRFCEVMAETCLRIDVTAVRHGDCPTGADRFAAEWVWWKGLGELEEPFPANWSLGKCAGPRRNALMLATAPRPVAAIGFPGGRGTANMVSLLKQAKVPVWEVKCR